jgi:peptidoglycan biosynthesis protein MviN/MurJ (putative lipid II flippase)
LLGSAFSLVVFLLLGIVLSPVFEAVGIVSANTVAYTLQAILLLFMLNKVLPGKLKLGGSTIKSILAAAIGGAAAYAVVNWAPGLAGTLIGAVAAFGVGIFLAALILRRDLHQIAEL